MDLRKLTRKRQNNSPFPPPPRAARSSILRICVPIPPRRVRTRWGLTNLLNSCQGFCSLGIRPMLIPPYLRVKRGRDSPRHPEVHRRSRTDRRERIRRSEVRWDNEKGSGERSPCAVSGCTQRLAQHSSHINVLYIAHVRYLTRRRKSSDRAGESEPDCDGSIAKQSLPSSCVSIVEPSL